MWKKLMWVGIGVAITYFFWDSIKSILDGTLGMIKNIMPSRNVTK